MGVDILLVGEESEANVKGRKRRRVRKVMWVQVRIVEGRRA